MEKEEEKEAWPELGSEAKSFRGRSTGLAQEGAFAWNKTKKLQTTTHMLHKRNCGVGTKLINITSCLNNLKKPEFSAQKRWPVPGQHV